MSGLTNMQKRIQYVGGANQQDRMVADKLKSLRKALLYSYQAATVVVRNTEDKEPREFRALINPNKVTMELDDKVLSIPFEDIRLNADKAGTTTEGLEPIGVKVGDIIEWKHTDNSTYWLVYDQYLQETAYFRGQMRQCEQDTIDVNGTPFHYYLKGPDEKGIAWQKSKHFIFNELNYTLELYISKTPETNEFFHRFQKLEVKGNSYEVQAVDRYSSDGILAIYLKEDYNNKWIEPEVEETPEETPVLPEAPIGAIYIEGPSQVYPYDFATYTIHNGANGVWKLSNKRAKILAQTATSVDIEITTGRSGDVSLIYTVNGEDIIYNISILSL